MTDKSQRPRGRDGVPGRSHRLRLEPHEGCNERGTSSNAAFTSAGVLLTTIGVRFLLAHVCRMPVDVP